MLLIFMARHAQLLGSRLVGYAGSRKQQRSFVPFTILRAHFYGDFRFCLLNSIARLFDSLLCLDNLVVAPSPIEWHPGQEKAGRGHILRKNLNIVDSLVAQLE